MSGALSDRQSRLDGWQQPLLDALSVGLLDNCGDDTVAVRTIRWLTTVLSALAVGRLEIATETAGRGRRLAAAAWALNPQVEVIQGEIVAGLAPWYPGVTIEVRGADREPLRVLGGGLPNLVLDLGATSAHLTAAGEEGADAAAPLPSRSRGSAALHGLAELAAAVVASAGAWEGLRGAATTTFAVELPPTQREALSVFFVGAGAVSNLLVTGLHLSGVRVQTLHVADFDHVDHSNLGRQICFEHSDAEIRRGKAEALAERAGGLLGAERVMHYAAPFHPDMLADFVREAGPARPLVCLATDNWTGRLSAMDAAAALGIPSLYGGTWATGAKVRLTGPGVPDSRCIGCGPERARSRAANEGPAVRDETTSCSAGPGSSVLSNLQAAANSLALIERYLLDETTGAGLESYLHEDARHRAVTLESCDCLAAPEVGTLHYDDDHYTVRMGQPTAVPGLGRAVGATLPGRGGSGAVVVLDGGVEISRAGSSASETGAIELPSGERALVGGRRWMELKPAERVGVSDGRGRCSFCLRTIPRGEPLLVCAQDHPRCERCGDGRCPWCDRRAEETA